MNYSKPMRINYKRLLTTWIISLIITSAITASITVLILKDKVADATEAVFYTHVEEQVMELLGEYTITAYCPCEICCGIWAKNRPTSEDGKLLVYTASGDIAVEGVTIAADTNILPFGTEVIIDGNKYIVQDRGRVIKNNRIDVYFENHQDALEFGVQYKEVFIERMIEND